VNESGANGFIMKGSSNTADLETVQMIFSKTREDWGKIKQCSFVTTT